MTIGQHIAQERKKQGLSQEALGDRLGVSRQSIYKWESGAALPEIDKLVALSRLFSVSVGWLLGVEEPRSDGGAPEDTALEDGELTEPQLKMVEEIAGRYIAAQPAPKKSAWDKWSVRILFAMCGAMLGILMGISGSVKQLDSKYNALQSSVSNVTTSVNSQISGISQQVESILKAQGGVAASYGTELVFTDPAENTATFSFKAVPKVFQAGMQAYLLVENDGASRTYGPYDPAGETFFSQVTLELSDSISLSILFDCGGVRQIQQMDVYEGLYSETLPGMDVHDDLMFEPVSENGVLALASGHGMCYVWIRPDDRAGAAAIEEVQVGLFKNQKLVTWASPCETPASYHVSEDSDFFLLPEMEIPLTAEDLLPVAAVVTDEYGRVTVVQALPYCIDTEDWQLTFSSSFHLDPDPTNWEFD
ncbi:MAG: helix-turn-helix domain-containing protein [Oscillospiraceae bacterium]|nr:helix-turn-helix domain-containing protein [Oscillospiraceae bacterium]